MLQVRNKCKIIETFIVQLMKTILKDVSIIGGYTEKWNLWNNLDGV